MAETVLRILGTVGLIAAGAMLVRAGRSLRTTSLVAAVGWAAFGWAGWLVTWIATEFVQGPDPALARVLWYLVAALMLCPPVAVLGARRPTVRVWTWFVLCPLLFVMGWPVLTVWKGGWAVAGFQVEAPMAVGYTLVLVMGTGNYFGTRHTLAAFVYALAALLVVLPLSTAGRELFTRPDTSCRWATLCLSASILLAGWRSRRNTRSSGWDRVWIDFRDTFGIVWAKRVMDRVNGNRGANAGPLRLEMDGLRRTGTDTTGELPAESLKHVGQTLRWLLRRFVDPVWIETRLSDTTSGPRPPSASRNVPSPCLGEEA